MLAFDTQVIAQSELDQHIEHQADAIAPSALAREYITAADVSSDRPSYRFLVAVINGKDAASLVVRPCDVVVAAPSLSALNRAIKVALGDEWCASHWSLAVDNF